MKILATMIAAAAVVGAATAATTTSTAEPSTLPQQCAAWRAQHLGITGPDLSGTGFDDLAVCSAYDLGQDLEPLRALAVQWDTACLAERGWRLDAQSNAPTPLSAGDYLPMRVADCATPTPTHAQCEQIRDGLAGDQQVYAAHVAAVLVKVGCAQTVSEDASAVRTKGTP